MTEPFIGASAVQGVDESAGGIEGVTNEASMPSNAPVSSSRVERRRRSSPALPSPLVSMAMSYSARRGVGPLVPAVDRRRPCSRSVSGSTRRRTQPAATARRRPGCWRCPWCGPCRRCPTCRRRQCRRECPCSAADVGVGHAVGHLVRRRAARRRPARRRGARAGTECGAGRRPCRKRSAWPSPRPPPSGRRRAHPAEVSAVGSAATAEEDMDSVTATCATGEPEP